jgi:hypothetical protein
MRIGQNIRQIESIPQSPKNPKIAQSLRILPGWKIVRLESPTYIRQETSTTALPVRQAVVRRLGGHTSYQVTSSPICTP